ncbi:unnamed protein product [Closterium sp. NIES-53]
MSRGRMVAGIRVKGEPDEVLGCPTCMQAKFTRYPFSSSEATAKAPLDDVVMDVVGPLKLGAAGAEYFLTIVDVYTRMTWVYVLSKKSDVAETVKTNWLPMAERQQDRLVKAIRTDQGREFLSKEFSLWLKKNGIRHSLTMPYSPAMNGIAERANWTITETARGLLIEAGLPEYLWPDAVRSACVAKNRALNHVGADKRVPYVEWIGRKPKVDMLRVFGCMCMALVPKHLRHIKLGAKAISTVHLGMAQNSKGWLLWDPFTKKFLVSRDCKFMENLMYKDWKAEYEAKIGMRFGEVKSSGLEHVELPLELSNGSTTTRPSSLVNGGEEAKDAEEEEEEVQQVSERAPTLPSRTTSAPQIRVTPQQRQGLHVPEAKEEGRGKRRTQAPNRLTYEALGKSAKSALAGAALIVGDDEESDYDERAFVFFSPVEMPGEPETLKEDLESSDAEEWKKAMESELKIIEENGMWELVELPEGRNAITSKWLFKIKSDANGNIERYNSRLVAKGYQQKEKVDYKELFAPVVKPTTLRTLLAGAAIKGWVVKQMDVTTAFLNGVLEEEIFMAQPEGFDDGSGRVLRLKKALYGLKQAPMQWYLKLRGVLEELGFTPSTADHSLFMFGEGEQRSFMVVYVDDILIFSPSSDLVKEVMLKLQDKFKCKALGDVSFYLGLHIERDVEKRCMRVHQRKYLEALAASFGPSEGHVATPFSSGFKCVKEPEEESVCEEERRCSHSLVGSLMYAAVNTRPGVAFATRQLARVVQCPNEEQVAAGMRVAKYLGQTPTVGLQYSAAAQKRQKGADGVEPGRLSLTAFSDASFTSEPEDMTSVGGFICCVGGGPTAWESKKPVDQAFGLGGVRVYGTLPCLPASSQVFAAASRSSPASAPCSCRPLAHETLLWHHRLGHPSLPRLRGMAFRALVSGLPMSLPPLPPGSAPTCVPCVKGRQRAAPHSSLFPPTEAPLQTLHIKVWGPACVCGQGHERYFLLVIDDYSRYTTAFPLRSKGEVPEVLIDWIRGARCQLSESFGSDLPVLRLHSDKGGEFPSDLLRAFCRLEGIRQMFTLPASPQQNGIAERRIGMVMDVARTSMIHAAAPHFLWPFAVQYAAHQINLQPRVSLPETTPALRWMGKVGDASAFRVWGSRALVRDTSADKLSSRADVTFDESVSYYRLFPYRTASPPPPPLFLAPGTPPVDPLTPQGPAPSGVSEVDPAEPVEIAVDSSAARGADPAGAGTGGAETGGAESGVWRCSGCPIAAGAAGAGAGGGAARTGDPEAEGTGFNSAVFLGAVRPRPYYVPLLQQVLGSPPSPGPPPPSLSPPPVPSPSQLQPASPLPGPSPYSGPTRGLTERREPESRPLSPASRSTSPVRSVRAGRVSRPRLPPVPGTHSMTLRPFTAPQRVPRPSPPASSLRDGPDLESDSLRAASPTATRFLATAVTDPLFESSALVAELVEGECSLGTDVLEDRQEEFKCFPASVPHLVSMLLTPEGDPDALDIPTPRCYAEAIEGPYSSQWQAAMDAEMASRKSTGTYVDEVPPPGANIVSGMWIFRVKQPPSSPPAFKARYVARGFSQRQGVDFFQTFSPTPKMTTLRVLLHVAAQRDYELHLLDFSTAFLQGSLHEEIWLRRPPGFTGSFPAGTQWSLLRPVYGLRQARREWHDTLRTTLATLGFAPSTADPSLFLRTDATLPPFYVLLYVDNLVFATADTEALAHVKSELQKRHTCTDLVTQVQQVLQRFGFTYSSPQSTPLPTGHSLSAPPSDESYIGGMGLVLGGRARVVLTGHTDASWVDDLATHRSSQGYTFSLGSGSVSWRSTRSSSVLSSCCEAEVYAGAMAAQELRWLTFLLTDLGEAPRSPPVLYVNNKTMLALCQEHRLEHRTKHIALRYFLARELQQRGQLRLAYVASQADTADVFTKALQPCDHQRFCTVLGLVPTVPHLLTS